MDLSFEKHRQDLSSNLDDALSSNEETSQVEEDAPRKVPIRFEDVSKIPELESPQETEETEEAAGTKETPLLIIQTMNILKKPKNPYEMKLKFSLQPGMNKA